MWRRAPNDVQHHACCVVLLEHSFLFHHAKCMVEQCNLLLFHDDSYPLAGKQELQEQIIFMSSRAVKA